MDESGEATAPVDQSQPSEVSAGGSLESSEAMANECYNVRAVMNATEMSTAEQSGNEVSVAGEADGENSTTASSEAWKEPDDSEASSSVLSTDLAGGELAGVEEGDTVSSSEQTTDTSEHPSVSKPEEGEPQPPDEAEGAPESLPKEDPLMAHWDPGKKEWNSETKNKIGKLARKRMFSSNYMLPRDFSKYFDSRTGQGPKQPLESLLARARRRFDEMKAWRGRVEEQSPMVYNRRVG